jgi:hypothetical protein
MKPGDVASQKGVISAGASLLWRRQEILWWVFAVNVVLGGLGTLGAARTLNAALGYSLAGNQLVKGFDLGMFYELLRLPEANFLHSRSTAYGYAILFAVFMLCVSGGILEVFRQDRRLNTADFIAASGAFFWRLVLLTSFSLVPFAVLRFMFRDVRNWSEYLGDKAVADGARVVILAAGIIVLTLVALIVRVWFDIAKVRTVAENESGMWHGMWTALDMTFRHLGTLLWIYFRIILIAAIILLIGFLIWTKLPPKATPATFIVLEFMILSQLAARLWQLASATAWYKRHLEVIADDAVAYMAPQPEEVIEAPGTPVVPEPDLPPFNEPEAPL